MKIKRQSLITGISIFAAYFITAKIGLRMDAIGGFATLVWPPTGIALASIILFGFRFWPAVFAAAFLINLLIGAPVLTSLGIAFGNSLEAVLAAYLLKRVHFHKSIDRVRDVGALVLLAASIGSAASATIGVASLWLGGKTDGDIGLIWRAWWIGDFLGDLIVAPLILLVAAHAKSKINYRRTFEGFFVVLALGFIGVLLFSSYSHKLGIPSSSLPYMLFPVMVWASLRFHQLGNALVIFGIAVFAIWGTADGYGPFSHGPMRENLFLLHGFLGVLALTGMTLAATMAERRQAIENQRISEKAEQFLVRASDLLTDSLDYETRLSHLAHLAIPTLGDWCLVDVITGNSIKRVATAHTDPSKEILLLEAQTKYPPKKDSPQPALQVLSSGKTLFQNELTDEVRRSFCYNEEHYNLMTQIGSGASVAVPLIFQGQITGVLTLGRAELNSYTTRDVFLIERLAKRAALAIENGRLYSEMQRSLKVRDDFLSIASHELRTPLTSLYMQLQMVSRLIKKGGDNGILISEIEKKIKLSENQAKQLGDLIDNLLDISQIDAGKITLTKELVDLTQLVKEIVAAFNESAKRAGSQLTLTPAPVIMIKVDKPRITQAISNLISNAIKYGDGKPIEVSLTVDSHKVLLVVKDYGMGISEQDQKRVFDRFERAISHNNISGMGLGLFITKEIITAHGGQVFLQSEPQKGCSFILEIPLAEKNVSQTKVSEKPSEVTL